MNFIFSFLRLDWWVYGIIVLSFFVGALVLNYVVKKINEARLEERFRLRNKASASRATQVEDQSSLPPRPPIAVALEQSSPPTVRSVKGVSLVFNKDEKHNEEGKTNDHIEINDAPNSKWLLTISDVADISTGNDPIPKPSNFVSNEINAQAFLGSIYKELNISEKSKSLSNADRDLLLDQIVDHIKKQESKSTPSLIKLLTSQDEDLRKWAIDLVQKTSEAKSNSSMSK